MYTPLSCLQGFVLGQYGLLYALEHEDQVERLFILNTPLALNSKLRPELAAYKSPLPFLRPGNVSCVLEHHGRLTHQAWLCPDQSSWLHASSASCRSWFAWL